MKAAIENTYRVPMKVWRRWDDMQQSVFNQVFHDMQDQSLFLHPKTDAVPVEQWMTTAWNAAWIAADAVRDAGMVMRKAA